MTNKEAIKILEDMMSDIFVPTSDDQDDAIDLAIKALEERPTGELISLEDLKSHKFLTPQHIQLGGRHNGKTIEIIDLIYQRGWNDAIDAIYDGAKMKKGEEEE